MFEKNKDVTDNGELKIFVLGKKNLRYEFDACGNRERETPAACIFKRFPRRGELFTSGDMEDIYNDINIDDAALKDKAAVVKELGGQVIKKMLKNLNSQAPDYKKFAQECIEGFENFNAEGGISIKTAADLLSLPEAYRQGADSILDDCYAYAMSSEAFSGKN